MTNRFPEEVENILRSGGWTGAPKDRMPVEILSEIEIFPAAEKVLQEFGGFVYEPEDFEGSEFARADFVIRPEGFPGIETYYSEEEDAIGKKLYPIGEYLREPIQILIAEDGIPYSWNGAELFELADNFDHALTSLILGKRPEGFNNYPIHDRHGKPGEKGHPRFLHLEEEE